MTAIQDFNDLDASRWFLRKELVKDDKKRIYMRQNSTRLRPYKFQLKGRESEDVLERALKDVDRDWEGSLLKSHPGFSSFSNTVGAYNGNAQVRKN